MGYMERQEPVFDFEAVGEALACLAYAARRALDESGVRLSQEAWRSRSIRPLRFRGFASPRRPGPWKREHGPWGSIWIGWDGPDGTSIS